MNTKQRNEYWPFLLFLSLGLILTLPAFSSDFYSGHNVATHILWSKHFAEQFWSGDLYPRWLMNMNDGLGSPAFYFYFPLPYFITSIFYAPLLDIRPDGWLQLGLSCATALSLSGVACYIWLRPIAGQGAAALGATIYILLPYHLLVDLYYRFAFTEFWTFAFMPLCLFFADRIQRNARFGVRGAAISYALLFLTHLPTVLIFSPILLFYFVARGQPGQRVRPFLRLSCALLLGAGLAAFYWLPAISTQSNVNFASMSEGEFYFENNFLFSPRENNPKRIELSSYHSFLSFSTAITLAISFLSWMPARRYSDKNSRSFWIIVCILSFSMMLEISSWLWHLLPLLHRVQFPYRLNVLLCLAIPALAASAMKSIPLYANSWLSKAWIVVVGAFMASQLMLSGMTIYKRATGEWDPETRRIIERELAMSPEVLEYSPRWADPGLFPVTSSEVHERPRAKVIGEGDITIRVWGPDRILVQTNGSSPLSVTLRHLFYPGWRAHDIDSGRRIHLFPSQGEGFISMDVPTGLHNLELSIDPGNEEQVGFAISILSLVLLAGAFCLTPSTGPTARFE